jgi:hypothetical protein
LLSAAVIGYAVISHPQADPAAAPADTSETDVSAADSATDSEATTAVEQPEYDEPIAGETERAPTDSVENPFDRLNGLTQKGFYIDDLGSCAIAIGTSAADIAANIEGDMGERVLSYAGFKDGMIVRFKSGGKAVVWQQKNDCQDPPYDPVPPRCQHLSRQGACLPALSGSFGKLVSADCAALRGPAMDVRFEEALLICAGPLCTRRHPRAG